MAEILENLDDIFSMTGRRKKKGNGFSEAGRRKKETFTSLALVKVCKSGRSEL